MDEAATTESSNVFFASTSSTMVKIEDIDDSASWQDETSSIASSGDEVFSDDDEYALTSYDPSKETLSERFYALKDMVSPSTRARLASSFKSATSLAFWTGGKIGSAAWIVTTSALLVGMPLMLAIEQEAVMVQQEREFMSQQAGGSSTYGATTQPPAGGAQPAGLVPPGF